MPGWLWVGLLALAPLALGAQGLGADPLVVFALATLSLLPLAALIGQATEHLAAHLGPGFGGLLNATFGNAAELLISGIAIQHGLTTLVKASITGSIIGNTLLVLGTSLLVGGVRHGEQAFEPRHTSTNAAMMILAVAALFLPAVFTATQPASAVVETVSVLVAGVLLATYAAYLLYSFTSHAADTTEEQAAGQPAWSVRRSLAVLGGSTAGAAVAADLLVGAVEPVTQALGWSQFFVGVILVPVLGNAAEHFSAVRMAWDDRLDVTFGITAGSSTQIALLVAPLLVLLSLVAGHPMSLIFAPLELAILGLATALFAHISLDGRANWLEGVQLLAIYLIAGTVFFFTPG